MAKDPNAPFVASRSGCLGQLLLLCTFRLQFDPRASFRVQVSLRKCPKQDGDPLREEFGIQLEESSPARSGHIQAFKTSVYIVGASIQNYVKHMTHDACTKCVRCKLCSVCMLPTWTSFTPSILHVEALKSGPTPPGTQVALREDAGLIPPVRGTNNLIVL